MVELDFDDLGGVVFNKQMFDDSFANSNFASVDLDDEGVTVCCNFIEAFENAYPMSQLMGDNQWPNTCLPGT